MNIYQYIRECRATHYRNAKACWKAIRAPFSYEYYSNIERGTKFPNIDTVLFLSEALHMDRKKACFLWAMECMPSKETKAYFYLEDPVVDQGVPLGPQITLEQTFLISEAHKRLLESTPLYWEVLSFFAMHEDQYFTLPEVMEQINMPKKVILKILGDLVHHNLLKYSRRRYAHPRTYMHIPNTREFFKLRNQNFLHATKQLIHALNPDSITADTAYRTTVNKKLTSSQIERLMRHLKNIVSEVLNMQSPLQKDEGIPYSFCVLFCERDFLKRVHK